MRRRDREADDIADRFFPFDAGAGADSSEDRWSIMARHWLPTGVLDWAEFGTLADAPLEVFADATGNQVKIHPGAAAIRGFYYDNDQQQTQTIATNSSGNPRIDRVVLRLDRDANTIGLAVVAGTPAASPSAPSLTQNETVYELPLAQVRAEHGWLTIEADKVTDERPRVRSADYAPRGEIAYDTAGSTVSGIDGTGSDLATTSSVYVEAGRKIKVTAHVRGISGTAGEQFAFKVFRGATQLEESVQTIHATSTTGSGCTVTAREVIATSGSYAWKVQARRSSGSNAGTVTVTSGGDVELIVEDIGKG